MNNATDFDFPASPPQEEILPSFASRSVDSSRAERYNPNPRKKRSKVIRVEAPVAATSSSFPRPKSSKKPDPAAPKITRPCSECGKKFWSWKALFGHMRCHPERQWRGINPPPNFRRPLSPGTPARDLEAAMTKEDHEVATCLLMLANGTSAFETASVTASQGPQESDTTIGEAAGGGDADGAGPSAANCRFECSSCKKVFGSHQALGGHRASHKNVKGCFAITRNDGEDESHNGSHGEDAGGEGEGKDINGDQEKMLMVLGHKCSICLKVFSSGQALGGHKRCHWERGDDQSFTQGLNLLAPKEHCGLDLNLPAPLEEDSSSSYSSGLALDLRLGI